MTRQINIAGLELIKSFEGFREEPYQDSAGVWTIGYGHTQGITCDSAPVTQAQAEMLLQEDLANAEHAVERLAPADVNDNQYAALVCLTYNAGTAPLTHTLGRLLNAGDYDGAALEFLKWNHAGGVVSEGLTRRREAERMLFVSVKEIS